MAQSVEELEKAIQDYDAQIAKLRAAKKAAGEALERTLAAVSAKAALDKMSPLEREAALALLKG